MAQLSLHAMGDEAILLAAGGRAILLQLANPGVGHAVAEHSSFASDPSRRLRHTLTFVYALTYGTPGQARFITDMVNRAHAPVKSASYDATDAHLQLWVNATLYESAMTIYELVYGEIAEADAEAIYADYSMIGVALQMPKELWPATRADFARYWDAQVHELTVDDTVRDTVHTLLYPPVGPLWLRAAMPLARLATAGLLSPELRTAFALPWDEKRQRRFDRLIRITRVVYPRLPKRLRHWPKNKLLSGIPDVPVRVPRPSRGS